MSLSDCEIAHILPRQVGGDLGKTIPLALDFYQGADYDSVLATYESESIDIYQNANFEQLIDDGATVFSILQVCIFDEDQETRDSLCNELLLPGRLQAARFFDDGAKVLAMSEELELYTIDADTLQIVSAYQLTLPGALGPGNDFDFVIDNDNLQATAVVDPGTGDRYNIAYITLHQALRTVLDADKYMTSFLVKIEFDASFTVSVAFINEIGVDTMWTSTYLASFQSIFGPLNFEPDPVFMYSGLSIIHEEIESSSSGSLCGDSSISSTAYWLSFVDSTYSANAVQLAMTDFEQTNCLVARCNAGAFKDEAVISYCIREGETYDWRRYKQFVLGQTNSLHFKKRPTIYLDEKLITASHDEDYSSQFYVCYLGENRCLVHMLYSASDSLAIVQQLHAESSDKVYATIYGGHTSAGFATPKLVELSEQGSEDWEIKTIMTFSGLAVGSQLIQPTPIYANSDEWHILYGFHSHYIELVDIEENSIRYDYDQKQGWLMMTGEKDETDYACAHLAQADWDVDDNKVDSFQQSTFSSLFTPVENSEHDRYIVPDLSVSGGAQVSTSGSSTTMSPVYQSPMQHQSQLTTFPWNECVVHEIAYSSDVTIIDLWDGDSTYPVMVPIPFGGVYFEEPCLYGPATAYLKTADAIDGAYTMTVSEQLYLLVPQDHFVSDQEYRLQFLFENYQSAEQVVRASFGPQDACGMLYSRLTYPTETLQFETPQMQRPFNADAFTSTHVSFSFRPAVFRSEYTSAHCDNDWQLRDISQIGDASGRTNAIFEQYDAQLVVETQDDFEHILVNFEAIVNLEWAATTEDEYPIELVLLFEISQTNSQQLQETIEEQVTFTLDLRCLFRLQKTATEEDAVPVVRNYIKDAAKPKQDLAMIQLPKYELDADVSCPDGDLKQEIYLDSELLDSIKTPWLIAASQSFLQLNLNLYDLDGQVTSQCHTVMITARVQIDDSSQDYLSGQLPERSETFQLCISIKNQGPKFLAQGLKEAYIDIETEFEFRLPPVQSTLPITAKLFVDDKEVPWVDCDGSDCPIRLELDSAENNTYKVVGYIAKPTVESSSAKGRRNLQQVEKKELSFLVLVIYEDTKGNVIQTTVRLFTSYEMAVAVGGDSENIIVVAVLDQDLNQVIGLSRDEPDSYDEDRLLLISQLKEKLIQANKQTADLEEEGPRKIPTKPKAKKFTNRGLLTILIDPEIDIPDAKDLQNLKDESFIQLQLAPNEDSVSLLRPSAQNYTWEFAEVTESKMLIQVNFEYPLNISCYQNPDLMIVTFRQTSKLLVPHNLDIQEPIADDYRTWISVPAQLAKGTEDIAVINVEEDLVPAMKTSLSVSGMSNAFAQFLVAMSLQMLWGMINGLQLVAHLPLYEVMLPANAQIMFRELQYVVSAFDYSEDTLFNQLPLGITETDEFNDRFRDLGYESLNIITNMGSILIALFFIIIKLLISLIAALCRCKHRQSGHIRKRSFQGGKKKKKLSWLKRCRQFQFSLWVAHQTNVNLILRFLLETILETLICIVIGLSYESSVTAEGQEMTKGDKASVGLTYAMLGILCAFPFLVVYFVVYKSRSLHRNANIEINFRYSNYIKKINEHQLSMTKKSNKSIMNSEQRKEETKLKFSLISYRNHSHYRKLRDQERNDYGFYEVFYSGLSLYKPFSRYYQLIFVIHRLLFVVSIFASSNFVWLQISFYIFACLLKGGYMLQTKPFSRKSDNRLEVINEFFQLLIGYIFLSLVTMVLLPLEIVVIGNVLIITVSVMIGCNSLFLLYGFYLAAKLRLRMLFRTRRCNQEVKASLKVNQQKWANRDKNRYRRQIEVSSSDEEASSVILTTEKKCDSSQDDETTPGIGFDPIEERESLSEISSQNGDAESPAQTDPFKTPNRAVELGEARSNFYGSHSSSSSFADDSGSVSGSVSQSSSNHTYILPNSGNIDLRRPTVEFGMSQKRISLKMRAELSQENKTKNSEVTVKINVKDDRSSKSIKSQLQYEEEKKVERTMTAKKRDYYSNLDFNIGVNLNLLEDNLQKPVQYRMPKIELMENVENSESAMSVSARSSIAQRKHFDYKSKDSTGGYVSRQSKYGAQELQAPDIILAAPFESVREITKSRRPEDSDERPDSLLTPRMRMPSLSGHISLPSRLSRHDLSSSNRDSSHFRQTHAPNIVIDPYVPVRKRSRSVVGMMRPSSKKDILDSFMSVESDLKLLDHQLFVVNAQFKSRSQVQKSRQEIIQNQDFSDLLSLDLNRRVKPYSHLGSDKADGSIQSVFNLGKYSSSSPNDRSSGSRKTLANAGLNSFLRSPRDNRS